MSARQLLETWAAAKDDMARRGTKLFNFERWLLDNGEEFGPVLDHELHGLSFGTPKECFYNAATAVMNFDVDQDEWFYTEGVVAFEDIPGVEIHHAWLSNRDGQVLDITSRHAHEPGVKLSYWGVPLKPEELRRQLLANGIYGLFSDGCQYLPITHQPVGDERAWSRQLRQEAA